MKVLVVHDARQFKRECEERGFNGKDQERVIGIMANGSNWDAMRGIMPDEILMLAWATACHPQVMDGIQHLEAKGAKVVHP